MTILHSRPALGVLALILAITRVSIPSAPAGDWPAYRHDLQRTATTDEKLAFPLKLAWRYTAAQPPAPAWHAPFRDYLINLADFDEVFAPVVANGLVFFGSSIHHVGIYIGGGDMIEAPYTGARVRIASAFRSDYHGACRPN